MAFCTSCGANVTGAFCNQCGTPARAAAGQPAPPPAPTVPQAPGAPVARKTSPLVWVLVIVLGLFVMGCLAFVGVGFFFVHKAKQAGIDSELMASNPGLAVAKMIAAVNPEIEVVRTNDAEGTLTVRDRKTGKETTITFDQAKSGKITFSAEDESGKTATIEIGGANSKLPSWIPSYPGATVQAKVTARGESGS